VARLLVLDLDGTLVDSSRDIAASVNATLRQLRPDAAAIPLASILGFVGEGARLLIERSLAHAGLALATDEVLALYLERYRERLLDTTRLYPGVAEALTALARPGGPALAVLTNKPGDMSRTILEGLGVAARFTRVVGAGDVKARKPDPSGLLDLLDELRIAARDAWMVGDSATDVRTARAAHVRAAGVTWGFHPAELRAAGPDRLLDDPAGLVPLAAE
jgi:phosphoglycolate phosphatase